MFSDCYLRFKSLDDSPFKWESMPWSNLGRSAVMGVQVSGKDRHRNISSSSISCPKVRAMAFSCAYRKFKLWFIPINRIKSEIQQKTIVIRQEILESIRYGAPKIAFSNSMVYGRYNERVHGCWVYKATNITGGEPSCNKHLFISNFLGALSHISIIVNPALINPKRLCSLGQYHFSIRLWMIMTIGEVPLLISLINLVRYINKP